jgi:GTP:adenosylcobinamide-phosphate guanylyltransferase
MIAGKRRFVLDNWEGTFFYSHLNSYRKGIESTEIGNWIVDSRPIIRGDNMPRLSAVVIAGEQGCKTQTENQETAMISVLGRPLIDYVLLALRGCREVSEVMVSITGSTPLTESHVRSRGYQSINVPGSGYDADLHHVLSMISTPYVLTVAANLPLLRSESIDDVISAFYHSKKSSLVVGVPIDEIQEVIIEPAMIKDMNGVKAMPCGVSVMDRNHRLNSSYMDASYLVTDLEDFAIEVNGIGQVKQAEQVLRARRWHERSPTEE